MCGIAGEIRFDQAEVDVEGLGRMVERMRPRGPDAGGVLVRGPVGLGHRRLKVIDTSERAEQPMADPDLGLNLVFNGCIYNYRELRQELEVLGHRFFSSGDTEVVLKAWKQWGAEALQRFEGMFAFAVHDRSDGSVTLVRDRLGIKPLYISRDTQRLRFASSLPALLAGGGVDQSIDPVALQQYLSFHAVVPAPRTILAGVRKLPPATLLRIAADGQTEQRTFWTVSFESDPELANAPREELVARVRDELAAAVRRRLVSDVPVGVLLSGGLDSSLVVGLLAEAGQHGLSTFSVGFPAAGGEQGDEFVWSRMVAKQFGTEHQEIVVDADRTLRDLDSTIDAMSEPMTSHDCVGFHVLSEEVAKRIKVVQSGQGADELFAGYFWYPPLLEASHGQHTAAVEDYLAVFRDRSQEEYAATVMPGLVESGRDHARQLVEEHFAMPGAPRPIDKALRIDLTTMLVDDPVKRVDNMTMAHGLEARVPFLDHRLVELAARIPAEHKVGGGGKGILKDAARGLLSDELIDRPKGYFPVPVLKHLQGPFLERVRAVVTDPASRARGIFREDRIDELLAEPERHLTPLKGSKLWQTALLLDWLQRHGIRGAQA